MIDDFPKENRFERQARLEKEMEKARQKILRTDRMIKKIPFRWIRDKLVIKKIIPLQKIHQTIFRVLRDVTRENYPERFS